MPINTREICDAITILTDQRNMRVALRQTGKGSLLCGTACFIGGLLLGPVGLAVGGTVGGVTAMAMTKGTFKSVSEIIKNDLTERQREELVERVVNVVRQINAVDMAMLVPMILGNVAVQQAVFQTVTSFVANELRMQIID